MADVRTDDMIGTIEIRTEDFQAIKSIELFPASFRVNDATQEVEYANDEARAEIVGEVADAVLVMAAHELTGKPKPAAAG